jgi:hypothetical protein
MRENRQSGSEGGGATALPTPIIVARASPPAVSGLRATFFAAPCRLAPLYLPESEHLTRSRHLPWLLGPLADYIGGILVLPETEKNRLP